MKGMMKVKLVIALLVVIAVAIFYYVSLPAINIHATETWKFIFLILAVLFVLYIVRKAKIAGQSKIELSFIKEYTGLKIGVIVFLLFLAVYVAGSILSSPIVNALTCHSITKHNSADGLTSKQTNLIICNTANPVRRTLLINLKTDIIENIGRITKS
jgi:hypothetical protein